MRSRGRFTTLHIRRCAEGINLEDETLQESFDRIHAGNSRPIRRQSPEQATAARESEEAGRLYQKQIAERKAYRESLRELQRREIDG